MHRRLTIIESPYAGATTDKRAEHLTYLRECLQDSWKRGELPFASHAFFPFFLRESNAKERQAGIEAGYDFWNLRNVVDDDAKGHQINAPFPIIAFYMDLGLSPGMAAALERCGREQARFELRRINPKEKD